MKTKILETFISGIIATGFMSIVLYILPIIRLPRMSPPEMLQNMLGVPPTISWILHIMIGITFAATYVYFFNDLFRRVDITNKLVRGILFGMAVFVFAQIAITVLGAIMDWMPIMEGTMMMTMIANVLGHIVYGISIVAFVKQESIIPVT